MAGMNQREAKIVKHDETIKYHNASDFSEHSGNYLSEELDAIDRFRYIESVLNHYERTRHEVQADVTQKILEQTLQDLDDDDESLTLADKLNLVHLSALCVTELPEQPHLVYHEWTEKVLKWMGRERELYKGGADVVDRVCSCIAVVEATFRPIPESMSIFPKLSKIIDGTKDANIRGYLIRLACNVCVDHDEAEHLATLIADAIVSPSEELIIHGIRAAAIFLDKFGDECGLDSDILEGDIPSAGQRECGVSKANIDRECRDIWEYVRAHDGEEHLPRERLVDDIDHHVEGFSMNEILRNVQRVFAGNVANNFQRTRNGVFRIAQRALGYNKQHRDRALGISKSHEQMSRDKAHKEKDRDRQQARNHKQAHEAHGEDDE